MKMMMMMMKRSLPRPNLICFTATRNLFPFLNHHYLIPTTSSSSCPRPRGLFFKVRFPTPNNSNIVRLRSSSMSSSSSPSLSEKGVQFNNNNDREIILSSTDDDHGGVIVEINTPIFINQDSNIFTSLLRASLSHWKQQGKKGVWIKLPIHLSNLIESVVKEGFYYHHAEPTYLMLVYWIPETANTLPANATYRVGIGAFVINEKREVLVIQEKSGKFRGTGIWKFPTGVVDEGEDICDAAVREVKEETGVDTKFVEVLAFRQNHKSFFDKSDLFFMCMLQPLSSVIQKQDNEIEAAQWMPFEEYAAQPFVQKHELLKYIVDICLAKKDGEYSGFSPVPTATISFGQRNYLYLNRHGLKSQ